MFTGTVIEIQTFGAAARRRSASRWASPVEWFGGAGDIRGVVDVDQDERPSLGHRRACRWGLTRDALPCLALAEAMTVLEITPWSGRPYNEDNPDGALRTMAFGSAGMPTHLEHRVDLLVVTWAR